MLIAIEGVDGAGKRTLSEGLRKAFEHAGKSVATLAFPRYGQSVPADIAAEALHGDHGDLASSVYAMAMLFALDRAGAIADIEALGRDHDVVILDRYVASNAAYSAARLHQDAAGEAVGASLCDAGADLPPSDDGPSRSGFLVNIYALLRPASPCSCRLNMDHAAGHRRA